MFLDLPKYMGTFLNVRSYRNPMFFKFIKILFPEQDAFLSHGDIVG